MLEFDVQIVLGIVDYPIQEKGRLRKILGRMSREAYEGGDVGEWLVRVVGRS